MLIQSYKIIGTKIRVYEALEPYAEHHTFTHVDGVRYGVVTAAPLPRKLAKLKPLSAERAEAVSAFYRALEEKAYAVIIAAHPETASGERRYGNIEVIEEDS